MYHLTTNARVPDSDEPPGFDLEKGDWVHPYGIGTVTDFTFRSSCNIDPPRRFQGTTYESALDAAVAALGVTRVHLVAKRRIVDDHAELLPGSNELGVSNIPRRSWPTATRCTWWTRADSGAAAKSAFLIPATASSSCWRATAEPRGRGKRRLPIWSRPRWRRNPAIVRCGRTRAAIRAGWIQPGRLSAHTHATGRRRPNLACLVRQDLRTRLVRVEPACAAYQLLRQSGRNPLC